MSLRVGWNFGSTAEDECQDVVMQDPPRWTATNAVLKAGRGLSSWLFSNLSPPSSPLVSSFFCMDPFSPRQTPIADYSSPPAASCTPYSLPTPSFISILPQELLVEIFREYLHGSTATTPSSNSPLTGSFRRIVTATGAKTTPFTLTHVTSSWRHIVMSNPSLWSRLCAFRPELHDIPLFELWLSLSSSCPLDLAIVEKGKAEKTMADCATSQLMLPALKHSIHWRTLSLQLGQDMEAFFISLSCLNPVPCPILQGFRIDLVDWTINGIRSISRFLSAGPVLRDAAWGNMCQTIPFIPEVSWGALRTIQFGHISFVDLHWVLSLTTSLESLSINLLQANKTSPFLHPETPRIRLPSLLRLKVTHYDDISPLFDTLYLPSLRELTLETGVRSNASLDALAGWSALDELVRCSGCRISSLDWSDSLLAEEVLVECFNSSSSDTFPDLHHLRIQSSISAVAIEAFTLGGSRGLSIFSSLRSLELRDCSANRLCLHTMLSSRPQLRTVDVRLWDEDGNLDHLLSDANQVSSL